MNADTIKGKILKDLIDAGKTEMKDFLDTGEEVRSYAHNADKKKYFEHLGLEAALWFKATIAMTAQAIDIMCPYLYPANPYRCGKVRKKLYAQPGEDQIIQARNDLMLSYLNFTPEETDLYGESIRGINQSQVYGAGVLWTGLNQRKGLVHSVWGDIRDLGQDPDAKVASERNWISRKWIKPRFEWEALYPKAEAVLRDVQPSEENKSGPKGKARELLTCHEVWMRVGIHRYAPDGLPQDIDPATGVAKPLSDTPRKFVVTDTGKLIDERNWEVPWFLDDEWPATILSYTEDEDCIWPISPMRAGLGHQKALNWLYIFYLTKMRFCSRTVLAFLDTGNAELGAESKDLLFNQMDDMPAITIKGISPSGEAVKIQDVFQQLNLDPGIANFTACHEIIKREFQEHTGMYDILQYGEGDTQDRSATATNFKERTSKTRINYRKDRVLQWQASLARKEAMAARFLHTPEQIDDILGEGAGQVWGQIMPPAEIPGNPFAVDFKQWVLETDYSVESSSMRRNDIDKKIDSLKEAMNQVVPTQLQSADLNERAMAYDTIADYYEAIGTGDDLVQKARDMATYLRQTAELQAQQMQQMQAMGQAQAMGQSGQPDMAPPEPAPAGAGGY